MKNFRWHCDFFQFFCHVLLTMPLLKWDCVHTGIVVEIECYMYVHLLIFACLLSWLFIITIITSHLIETLVNSSQIESTLSSLTLQNVQLVTKEMNGICHLFISHKVSHISYMCRASNWYLEDHGFDPYQNSYLCFRGSIDNSSILLLTELPWLFK